MIVSVEMTTRNKNAYVGSVPWPGSKILSRLTSSSRYIYSLTCVVMICNVSLKSGSGMKTGLTSQRTLTFDGHSLALVDAETPRESQRHLRSGCHSFTRFLNCPFFSRNQPLTFSVWRRELNKRVKRSILLTPFAALSSKFQYDAL